MTLLSMREVCGSNPGRSNPQCRQPLQRSFEEVLPRRLAAEMYPGTGDTLRRTAATIMRINFFELCLE